MNTRKSLAILSALLIGAGSVFATDNSTSASATNEAEASNGNGAPLHVNASNFAGFTPPGAALNSTRNDVKPGSAKPEEPRESHAGAGAAKKIEVPPPANPAAAQK